MNGTVNRDASFTYFVYPFLFGMRAEGSLLPFESLSQKVDDAELDGKKVWQRRPFPTADLMPHVGSFLDSRVGEPVSSPALTARSWKLSDGLENTYGLAGRAQWHLSFNGKREIPFRLGKTGDKEFALELVLFSIGVGFVIVHAIPQSDALADWLDFVHAFRFLRGRGRISVRAEKKTGRDQTEPFVPPGIPNPGADHEFSFMDVIAGLLKGVWPQGGDWWRPVFMPDTCLPFTCLYARGVSESDRMPTVYRMRHFFHATQDIQPSMEDLRAEHPMSLAYTANQSFQFSLNGGTFASFDAPDTEFFNSTLPNHLRGAYFLAFLLVLHQRFALAMLSEHVVYHGLMGSDEEQEKAFERIRDALLLFTARGYFAQAMQSDHHHRYYCKWQEVLQIPRFYEEVRNEVRDMYERATLRLRQRDEEREDAEEKREARFEKLLTILGAIFIAPSLILSFLGVNLRGITSGDEGLAWHSVALLVLVSMGAGGLLLWILLRWLRNGGDDGVNRC